MLSLRTMINGGVNVIWYDPNGIVSYYLRTIPQNDLSQLIPLHAPTE